MTDWPKKPHRWLVNRVIHLSIPFTWNLPDIRWMLQQRSFFWDRAVVGGPAVKLLPDFFNGMDHVTVGGDMPGVLQRVNPMATRTTVGCIRKCRFCGVRKFEGAFRELDVWPDLPVICDNNLLAAGQQHFDRVIDRLIRWGWADFNQGLDARLLTDYHAARIAGIKRPLVRLALDTMTRADPWIEAIDKLRRAGIAKSNVKSYALIGFDSGPDEAWERCRWIEGHGVRPLPMWFHRLDQLEKNIVTPEQETLGWNDYERRKIMQWFYRHKRAPEGA